MLSFDFAHCLQIPFSIVSMEPYGITHPAFALREQADKTHPRPMGSHWIGLYITQGGHVLI